MAESARDRILTWSLAAAVMLQGVNLIIMGRLGLGPAIQVGVVTVALVALVASAWRHRLRLNHRVDMLLVMAAFGGLGMLLGWWGDLGFVAPPADADLATAMGHGASCPLHGGGGGGFWAMVGSWMTAGMLLGAIPPALLATRCAELARTDWRRFISTHFIGNALMVAAMIWVGHWIGPGLSHLMGSAVLGGHTGMMLGMLLGMEAGMFFGEAALGLAPWREWTWRAQPAQTAPLMLLTIVLATAGLAWGVS